MSKLPHRSGQLSARSALQSVGMVYGRQCQVLSPKVNQGKNYEHH